MVGLQPSSGSLFRQHSFLSGSSMTLGAGPALEQLKKTADRLVEEQQSTKQATEAYRLKLQEVQGHLSELQVAYSREKTENTQLKANIKDDQQQIEYVTSKVSMVETMHDGLRLAMSSLRTDVQDVEIYRNKLSGIFDTRFAHCEVFGDRIEQLQTANITVHDKLTSAMQDCVELKENIVQLTASMEHNKQGHQDECSNLVKDLHKAEMTVAEHRQACEDLQTTLSKTLHDLSVLQTSHAAQAESHSKQVLKLEEDVQAARLHITTVESDLHDSLAKADKGEESITSLQDVITGLKDQLQAGTEQAESLRSDLLVSLAQYDALTAEHTTNVGRCQELSVSLQQSEEALQAKVAEFEQVAICLESERAVRETLSAAHEQKIQEIADLQCLIATAADVSAKAQEGYAAQVATTQAELAASRQETLTVREQADLSVREAVMSADKKVHRLTERTAKELEDFRKKCKTEAEKEQKKMQSQLLILEEEKKTLDAKVAEEHEQLQAATALHKELSDQVLKVTESQEQKSKDDAIKADQRMAELQESHGKETAALVEKQHLELQQTVEAGSKQKEALADLEKRLDQLKLDHEQVISKHVQEKEALLKSSEDAKDAAVKELQSAMDTRVKHLLGDLSECQESLQATTSKLQRSEMSVDAAQLELDNLKGHAREQEIINGTLHEELIVKQGLLNNICRAAGHASQSPAAKESPSGRRKGSESKKSPVHESKTRRAHKNAPVQEETEEPGEALQYGKSKDSGDEMHAKPAPEPRRQNAPPRFASAVKKPKTANDSSEEEEEEASSDEEEDQKAYQMEKEKRKRAASRAPKQHVNKKGRSEKPAVTQGRRSKFTAMSAQTVTSEDDDAETHQHKRKVSKADRSMAISARAKQPTVSTKKRLPANSKLKNTKNGSSIAADFFGTVSLDPYTGADPYAYG